MAESTLVEADIKTGEQVVRALDAARDPSIHPSSALWFRSSDEDRWQLLLALPAMEDGQPQSVYTKVLQALVGHVERFSFESISLLPPGSPLLALLGFAIQTSGDAVSGIRLTNNVINGHLIDDAYIYRLSRSAGERAAAG